MPNYCTGSKKSGPGGKEFLSAPPVELGQGDLGARVGTLATRAFYPSLLASSLQEER